MAFFEAFQIDWISLVWYLVVFLIALWALKRLFYGPVLNLLADRERKIADSLQDAADARDSIKKSKEKAEMILWDASTEAQEIIRNGEKISSDIQDRARQAAKTEADVIITRARSEIDRERQSAQLELRRQAVDIALFAATRVIEENLDSDRNRELAEAAIREAELHA